MSGARGGGSAGGRRAVRVGAALLAVVLGLGAALVLRGAYRLRNPVAAGALRRAASAGAGGGEAVGATPAGWADVAAPAARASVPPDRGRRLAHLCAGCHSSTGGLPLSGGEANLFAGLGVLYAPDLTPGGPLAGWTDEEVIRAIREGVDPGGRALLVMPSDDYRVMSDADVAALVAYLRAQPAVAREVPATRLNPFGLALLGLGVIPASAQPPVIGGVEHPSAADTLGHGRYLVTISGCSACHGPGLRGGDGRYTPKGPDLVAALEDWSPEEFRRAIRAGVAPGGRALDPGQMPWPSFSAAYTDGELRAIYEYIRSLAAGRDR